jgi:hypothetical protein
VAGRCLPGIRINSMLVSLAGAPQVQKEVNTRRSKQPTSKTTSGKMYGMLAVCGAALCRA